jgi:hypothetical protein
MISIEADLTVAVGGPEGCANLESSTRSHDNLDDLFNPNIYRPK